MLEVNFMCSSLFANDHPIAVFPLPCLLKLILVAKFDKSDHFSFSPLIRKLRVDHCDRPLSKITFLVITSRFLLLCSLDVNKVQTIKKLAK